MRLCWGLVPVLCATIVWGQSDSVETHLAAAAKARAEKRYPEAEREGAAAVTAAEKMGPGSPRLNAALADLALTYQFQRNNGQAEILWARAAAMAAAAGITPLVQ